MEQQKFKILMVTCEAVPFAKTGGLADMVSSLSRALADLGHDVKIVMPRYYGINKDKCTKLDAPLGVPLGFNEEWLGVYKTNLPDSTAEVYFLDHEELFGRDGVYGENGITFNDNSKRFTLLSRASFQLCKLINWIPDVMHSHDWVAGLVPIYLYTWEKFGPFAQTGSVFTIHNIGYGYQGVFPKEDLHHTQLKWEEFHSSGLEHFDTINFLKGGIKNADVVTTVSPTFAGEIQSPEMGCGLDGLLRHRSHDLFGILNGIDYDIWDPETDTYIKPNNYSASKLDNKKKVKMELQKRAGLEINPDKPIVGIVSRLTDQKGFGALCGPSHGSLYSICADMDLQFVILGSATSDYKWCENELKNLEANLPNLKVFIEFSEEIAHLIEAGSDFFLMPSKYEPCGLNQMYSLRYGTLPIVRRTGGLADTVKNYNEYTGEGTGFMFDELTPRAIYDVVGWAMWAYYNKRDHIEAMRKRAMQERFSWEVSANHYVDIYQWAKDRKIGYFPRVW